MRLRTEPVGEPDRDRIRDSFGIRNQDRGVGGGFSRMSRLSDSGAPFRRARGVMDSGVNDKITSRMSVTDLTALKDQKRGSKGGGAGKKKKKVDAATAD